MKKIVLIIGVLLSVFSAASYSQELPVVKNVILMIGDGMSYPQIYAAYTLNKGSLQIERAAITGILKTSSANNYITDSGAAATALSSGVKTYNGAIGVDAKGKPVKTILESAEENELATGLISTSAITHATPASFIAHDSTRNNMEGIAADFAGSGVDLFIGGGRDNFEKRKDSANISDILRNEGYSVVYDMADIHKKDGNKIACLTADEHMPRMLDGRGPFLEKATELSLERLSRNDKGFFIMIEGSQIDWGGHDNDIHYVVTEMLDFDRAVGKAFDFADKNPGTLVVVAADHETGGLSIIGGDINKGLIETSFSTTHHTALMVPVFAYGTGSAIFSGMYENTEIYHKLMKLLQLD